MAFMGQTRIAQKVRIFISSASFYLLILLRLAINLFLHDTQSSMALLKSPLMSLSELLCPLPASRDLWFAQSASEWKSRFLQKGTSSISNKASLVDGLRNSTIFDVSQDRIDIHLSYLTALYGF